ncbi:MAG: hemerythrin domain-containing protein [Thermoplasmataceae archaeon]
MNNEIWLTNDHKYIDEKLLMLLKQIESGELNQDLFDEISSGLKRHIYFEETSLFPALKLINSDIHSRLEGLKMEHAAVWKLLDVISDEIDSKKFIKTEKSVKEISMIFKTHNEIEEKNIYRLIKKGTEEDQIEINGLIVPENWVCEKLRYKRMLK